ncbi:hypothetical protein [Acinetobacter sp. WCHAc010034]|uniref:hypothetical protein n=1 Tax=Acinetobacter sp. WCHAc010034 TaxID=1879049 RepID=UPI0013C325C6|nr:hypothetical protein [Acinetobacter sp. WCHAc010034]
MPQLGGFAGKNLNPAAKLLKTAIASNAYLHHAGAAEIKKTSQPELTGFFMDGAGQA